MANTHFINQAEDQIIAAAEAAKEAAHAVQIDRSHSGTGKLESGVTRDCWGTLLINAKQARDALDALIEKLQPDFPTEA